MSTKNSNNTIGNRTRDLQASSAVPKPTAPPRDPTFLPDLYISQVGKVEEKCLPIRPSCRWEHQFKWILDRRGGKQCGVWGASCEKETNCYTRIA